MIKRFVTEQIQQQLGKGKIIVLYGPRRIGKTTVAKQLLNEVPESDRLYLNCDELAIQQALESRSMKTVDRLIGQAKRIVIDEAQRVTNIGVALKLIIDSRPELDIIATGSSSFDLSSKIKEPLTGRSYEFVLEPLSLREIASHYKYSDFEIPTVYERLMRFGGYPDVVLSNETEATTEISLIAERYIYKDTLELVELRQRQLLPRLLIALALQIGQEVSYNELANTLGVRLETVERYITILEAAFIVYRLPALTANKRNQVSNRKRKVYFSDLGVRNALIENFNPLLIREDTGGLWENFCMNERRKSLRSKDGLRTSYYWRGLYSEVDLVEQSGNTTDAFEFKWSDKGVRVPRTYRETYPDSSFTVVHKDNLIDHIL